MCREQALERPSSEQRHVARKQDEGAGLPGQQRFGLLQRVRGPELGLLNREPNSSVIGQSRSDGGASVAHDDGDCGWSHSAGGVEHVLDHGPPRHRVEHLGKL